MFCGVVVLIRYRAFLYAGTLHIFSLFVFCVYFFSFTYAQYLFGNNDDVAIAFVTVAVDDDVYASGDFCIARHFCGWQMARVRE